MKLWLDDVREPWRYGRVGWTWVKTVEECLVYLYGGEVSQLSLDHDLEPKHYENMNQQFAEGTGYDVAKFIEERPAFYPVDGCFIHTMNPAGRNRMFQALSKAYQYNIKHFPGEDIKAPEVVYL